jgi:hypothetical protein
MKVNIQGLFTINPKTKEYFVKIGNLQFPFKSADEILAYFLGLSKIKRFINQRMDNFNKQTKTMSLSPLSSLLSLSLSQRLRLVSQLSPNLSKNASAFPSHFVCFCVLRR